MGEKTKVPWCHHTFNPWWGCTKKSDGCANCYAERLAIRYGFQLWGADAPRRMFSEKHWREPLKWNTDAEKAGERRRVFCGSMCDVFEDNGELCYWRRKLSETIAATQNLDWLLLTKRPENMENYVPLEWAGGWPANVWPMTTVENQAAVQRVGHLLKIPATINVDRRTVRGTSLEPLLGPVDLSSCTLPNGATCHPLLVEEGHYPLSGFVGPVHWIIIGCESGPHRRRCELNWVRDLIGQGRAAGVAVFVKQLEINGRVETDSRRWPEDLRIQEFPRRD